MILHPKLKNFNLKLIGPNVQQDLIWLNDDIQKSLLYNW